MSEQTTPDGAESPIIVERQGRVGHIRLNRPKALNALNEATTVSYTHLTLPTKRIV